MKRFTTVLCKRSICESTYNKDIFEQGKFYPIVKEDNAFIFLKSKYGHEFYFSKELTAGWAVGKPYWIDDYFE